MQTKNKRKSIYDISPIKYLQYIFEYILLSLIAANLFYGTLYAALPLLLLAPLFVRYRKREDIKSMKKRLGCDFKNVLDALAISLRAGYSAENSFAEAKSYLENTLGKDHLLTKNVASIVLGSERNIPLGTLLKDFASKFDIPVITDFADVFITAKSKGGNISDIVCSAADSIGDTIIAEREIESAIASRKLEQRIMSFMPAGIIAYMKLTSPDFITPLYGNLFGISVMTICMAVYVFAFYLGNKIISIKV